MTVVDIDSVESYRNAIGGEKMAAIFFDDPEVSTCRDIKSSFESYSTDIDQINFFQCDIKSQGQVVDEAGSPEAGLIVVYKNGKTVDWVPGEDFGRFLDVFKEHS